MMRKLILHIVFISCAFGNQPDSVTSGVRFDLSIRSAMAETSMLLIFAGTFGFTADVDFLALPSETIPRIGLRYSYQEINRGLFQSRHADNVFGNFEGVFVRATHQTGNTRTDIFLGSFLGNSTDVRLRRSLAFGADIRWIFFSPISSLFMRIVGNPDGMTVLFGISIGYVN